MKDDSCINSNSAVFAPLAKRHKNVLKIIYHRPKRRVKWSLMKLA